METIITRDTDIIREYLVALDNKERSLSPFAKFAALNKLTRLREELGDTKLEATDEDLTALKQEIDERLTRTFWRRMASSKWGARLALFLMLVGFQQLILLICLLATWLFARYAPTPGWWPKTLPHEEPVSLYLFVFLFFFAAPMLSIAAIFSGRFFRSWRKTVPISIFILALSIGWTIFIFKYDVKEKNPVSVKSSLFLFAKNQGTTEQAYREAVKNNWLFSDAKFQGDYETYLRNGPGRWITSKLSASDAAWRNGLQVVDEYVNGGQDPDGFRDWLTYYLDRNRIYSEDRIEQEARVIATPTPELGIWQVEPFLRERDEHIYRAYLGDVNRSMRKWGLVNLGIYALLFLIYYLIGPVLSVFESATGRTRRAKPVQEVEIIPPAEFSSEYPNQEYGQPVYTPAPPDKSVFEKLKERYFDFPERREIVSTPYFDEPFTLMEKAHRSFMALVILTGIVVFVFWALVYALAWHNGKLNAPSQVALMRSHLLFNGSADNRPDAPQNAATIDRRTAAVTVNRLPQSEASAINEIAELDEAFDENEYTTNKRFKEHYQTLMTQNREITALKGLSSQLEQTTTQLPNQVAQVDSRAAAAEGRASSADARAGQALGAVEATNQKADELQKQLGAKLGDVETRAARAAEQAGQASEQASRSETRTEALEKELDRRARQVEARTEELGERTAALQEREERLMRLQRATFAALVADLRAEVDTFAGRIEDGFYKSLSKNAVAREAKTLTDRINAIEKELRDVGTEQANQFIAQLETVKAHLAQAVAKAK
ncbi:MAG: hypothetical protein AB1757_00665 [Acidobacteriota bacterium]